MKISRYALATAALIALLVVQLGCERQNRGGEGAESKQQLRHNRSHPNYLECDFYDTSKKFCLVTLSTVDYYGGRKHDPIWLAPGTKVVWIADTDDKFTVAAPTEDPSCESSDAKKTSHKQPFDTDIATTTPTDLITTHVRGDADKGSCFDINITKASKNARNTAADPHVYVGDGP
ncbi:MAG TPA: hypothetical protein VFU50_07170 [Terriglobales bacterium]|nr:hypothetical protein [Terriglobales bacterium]